MSVRARWAASVARLAQRRPADRRETGCGTALQVGEAAWKAALGQATQDDAHRYAQTALDEVVRREQAEVAEQIAAAQLGLGPAAISTLCGEDADITGAASDEDEDGDDALLRRCRRRRCYLRRGAEC